MNENKKILEFYSDTCRPCKLMLPIAQKIAMEMNIPLEKYEVSKEIQMAEKYGVKSVPSFVLLKNGIEAGRIVGAVSARQLEEFFGS